METFEILHQQGNCAEVGSQVMYPPEGDKTLEAIAKSVCEGCVVIDLCRTEAMVNHEAGVWGGMTEIERNRLKHKISRERKRGGV